MRRSLIIDTTSRIVFHSALVFSLYLLFTGHNQPGGGFVGGLVAGAAFALVYVAGGLDDVRNLARLKPWHVLGTGLALSAATTAAPLLFDHGPLESGYATTSVPVLGDVSVSSTLAFDIGVYAVVIGIVLMVLEGLGEERNPSPRASRSGEGS
jgi:multisubunit Na+/H+ antiporter MnhB subunit